jgi:EpsD family peptidyl-prolyl cis-trans isomerase
MFQRPRSSSKSCKHPLTLLATMAAVAALAGCGGADKDEKKAATQSAARVNKEEITVHQINFLLQQQRGLRAEQAEEASKQVLERLIDQELAIQKASELKLDRDPRVVTQIDAARREIIARAYIDKVGEGAPKPSEEEIKSYYEANPALFSERRLYQLQELAIEAKPEQVAELRERLKSAKSVPEFVQYLQANNIRFASNQAVRAAEQLPLATVGAFAKMKDGDTMLNPSPTGVQVIALINSRSQPVDAARARPAIEQFLLNDRKRKLVADDLKAMRASADLKYLGKFAEGAPAAAPVSRAPTPAEVAASASKALDESAIKSGFGLKDDAGAGARPSAVIAEPAVPSASSVDAATINKGLGIK